MKCEPGSDSVNELYKLYNNDYELRAKTAIENFIGKPLNPEDIKDDNYKDVYKYHKELYNLLLDHTIDVANRFTLGFMTVDPEDIIDAFADYLPKKIGGKVIDFAFVGTRTMKALVKLTKDAIYLKNKEMNKTMKSQAYPDYVSFRLDKTGKVSKIVREAGLLNDRIQQFVLQYRERFRIINRNVRAYTDSLEKSGIIDLNDLILKPISGLKIKGKRKKGGFRGEPIDVTLHEVIYNKQNKAVIDGYIVEDDRTGTKMIVNGNDFWFPRGKSSRDYIRDKIFESGTTHLIDELGHGEVRKLMPVDVRKASAEDIRKIKWMLKASAVKGKLDQKSPYIHTKRVGEYNINYVMVKQGEDDIGEVYNTYIVGHEDTAGNKVYYFDPFNNYNPNTRDSDVMLNINDLTEVIRDETGVARTVKAFQPGFYRASDQEKFGPKLNKFMQPIKDSTDKEYVGFEYMKKQPPDSLVETEITDDGYNNIWEALHEMRSIFDELWDVSVKWTNSTNADIVKWFKKAHSTMMKGLDDLVEKGELDADLYERRKIAAENIFRDLQTLGVENRMSYDEETNEVSSLAMFMSKKSENYFPSMFLDKVYDKFVLDSINEIDSKLEFEELSEKEAMELEKARQDFMDTQEIFSGNRTVLEQRPLMYKHRKPFTNDMLRRKDNEAKMAYLDILFNRLLKNRLLADTVQAITEIQEIYGKEKPPFEQIRYMTNQVKSAMGDPYLDAKFTLGPLSFNVGSPNIAKRMNQIFGTDRWTAESVDTLFKHAKGFITTLTLGSWPALTNRGQVANPIIIFGLNMYKQAIERIEGPDADKWTYIADYGGATNQLTFLNDIILTTVSDLHWNDALFYQFPKVPLPVPHPNNLLDYGKLLLMDKKMFIEKGHPLIDGFIDRMLQRRLKKSRSMKEEEEIKYLIELRKEIREGWINLAKADKNSNNTEFIKKNYIKIVGKVKDTQLKKFISWKLTWFFNGAGLGENPNKWFTFVGTESQNRKIDYIMGVLAADAMGNLGSKKNDKSTIVPGIKDRFLSPDAAFAGRLSVESHQFNMAQVHAPEAGKGFGQTIRQFKDYPLKQSFVFGRNVRQAFMAGSDTYTDMMTRLLKATTDVLNPAKENLVGEKLDYEALSMARMILSRGLGTIMSALVGNLSKVDYILRSFGGRLPATAMRGIESPVLSFPVNIAIRWLLFSLFAGDDDKDRKKAENAIRRTAEDTMRLLIPVYLSLFASYMLRVSDFFGDKE